MLILRKNGKKLKNLWISTPRSGVILDRFLVTKVVVKTLTQSVEARSAVSAGEKARRNKKDWIDELESTEEYSVQREENINRIGFKE